MIRINTYLILAIGLAFGTQCLIPLLGYSVLTPETGAGPFLTATMWMPTVAVLITKLLNRNTRIMGPSFKPKFKGHIRYYVLAWPGVIILSILGAVLFFVIFPQSFNTALTPWRLHMEELTPGVVFTQSEVQGSFVRQLLLVLLINIPISALTATLGEEIGWRGFLFPALQSRMSDMKAHLWVGVIWGLWHLPVIAMGYNYGVGYPGYPWLGILLMCLACLFLGIVFSFVTSKTGSIWPAALAHATVNVCGAALPKYLIIPGSIEHLDLWGMILVFTVPMILGTVLIFLYNAQQNKKRSAIEDPAA